MSSRLPLNFLTRRREDGALKDGEDHEAFEDRGREEEAREVTFDALCRAPLFASLTLESFAPFESFVASVLRVFA